MCDSRVDKAKPNLVVIAGAALCAVVLSGGVVTVRSIFVPLV